MTSPTPDEIRAERSRLGLTQTEAGALIYASLRAWQDWEAGLRRMHPAFWALFQLKTKRRKPP
jgi:putative transcriptional regulator